MHADEICSKSSVDIITDFGSPVIGFQFNLDGGSIDLFSENFLIFLIVNH